MDLFFWQFCFFFHSPIRCCCCCCFTRWLFCQANIMPPLFHPTKRYKTHHDYGRCVCVYICDLYLESQHIYTDIYWWEKEGTRVKKNHILVEGKKKTENYRWNLFSLSESHTHFHVQLSFFSLNRRICFVACVFIYITLFMLFNVLQQQWLNVLSTLTTRNCNLVRVRFEFLSVSRSGYRFFLCLFCH